MDGTATGEITATTDPDARDHDWFAVQLVAGKTYVIEVRGADSGDGTLADPVLIGLYDRDGKYIAGTGDDNTGPGRDALMVFAPTATGIYYVAARAHGADTGTYKVAVTEGVPADDFAASTATTGTVAVGATAAGEITAVTDPKARDHDWFAVTLEADKTYQIEVRGAGSGDGPLADPVLVGLYDKDGALISGTGDDNSGPGRNALKLFTPDAAGAYYVAVGGHNALTGTYTVAVTEGVAKDDHGASATLATVEMSTIKVAEGGKVAFTVSLSEAATGAVTVQWSVSGAVTAGDDYKGTAGPFTLSFAAGETKKTVEIHTVNDTVSEDDEALTVTLSNPTGAMLGTTVSATVTITDDDPKVTDAPPTIPVGQQTADDDEPPRLELTQADGLVLRGTEGADVLTGTDRAGRLEGLGGADRLNGAGGNDELHGGRGRDVLLGKAGHGRHYGEDASDTLRGGEGKDWLEGGRGDDVLYGGAGGGPVRL